MKKYLFMAVATIVALSSCTNGGESILNDAETDTNKALVFTATIEDEDASRAIYGGRRATWQVGDEISINGKKYVAQSSGPTTTFKAKTPGQEATGPTYNAYFGCEYDGTTATLPASINDTWEEGKFNMPMYATSNGTNLQFHNLCGVLAIKIKKADMSRVDKITVGSTLKRTSGEFVVENNSAKLINPNSQHYDSGRTVTVNYPRWAYPTDDGIVFYIPVPAQDYYALQISVDGIGIPLTQAMVTTIGKQIKIERNKVYPITFKHNATYATYEGYVKTVQLWDGGPKFAEYNICMPGSAIGGKFETRGDTFNWNESLAKNIFYWGDKWLLPEPDDFEDLLANCDKEGAALGGYYGYWFKGRGNYASNKVFFTNGHYMTTEYIPPKDGTSILYTLNVYYNGPNFIYNECKIEKSGYISCFVRPMIKDK